MVQQQWEKGKNIFQTFKNYLKWFFDISDGLEEKESVINNIKEGVSFRGTNILILILAMFIASLGLNVNSTAVIIGAMLISPLMGPIIGMGLGLGIHDMPLIKRSFRNLAMAALFSIIASTLYFLITPLSEERSELLARTSPTIYDVLIAFFGGCAGILALSSKQKGNVLPGVAIATALMPPLCTAGYGLATSSGRQRRSACISSVSRGCGLTTTNVRPTLPVSSTLLRLSPSFRVSSSLI